MPILMELGLVLFGFWLTAGLIMGIAVGGGTGRASSHLRWGDEAYR